jgi:hypothetical protein
MTSTAIATTDPTTGARDDQNADARLGRPDPSSPTREVRATRRLAVAVLASVLVVMGVTAGIAYRAEQSGPQPAGGASSATVVSDAAESAHGARAGLATGTGLPLGISGRAATSPGSDAALMAHGTSGSVVVGR